MLQTASSTASSLEARKAASAMLEVKPEQQRERERTKREQEDPEHEQRKQQRALQQERERAREESQAEAIRTAKTVRSLLYKLVHEIWEIASSREHGDERLLGVYRALRRKLERFVVPGSLR